MRCHKDSQRRPLFALVAEPDRHSLFVSRFSVLQALLFDVHIREFVRVEDFAAFQTFYKLSIFFPS